MNATLKTFGLAFALATAAAGAACGPPPPPDLPTPPTQNAEPSAAPSAAPTTVPTTTPTAAAVTAPAAASGPTANIALQHSKMIDDVKKLGIDFSKTPSLDKLSLSDKKKLMPFFQRSLGFASCTGCHAEGDFKKDTRNIKIARGMWTNFVHALRDDKGGQIFCDSCHNGQSKLLNRADKKAVSAFMDSDYEHKLSRADKKDNECSTCHGDAMETKIIEKIWKVPN